MVSAEVRMQFAERGVQLIPPAAGRQKYDEELRFGRHGQVEVIIGDGPWQVFEDRATSAQMADALPLLDGNSLRTSSDGTVELIRKLDPALDRYLDDHRLDGNPVFPAAMAAELMVEVVQRGWPKWEVVGIKSLRVLRGIVLDKGSRELHIVARPQTNPSSQGSNLEINVEIDDLDQLGHPCYRASVQLAERLPEPPPYELGVLSELRPFPMTAEESYRRWLFHGPCFQGISMIEGINEHGIAAVLLPFPPAKCLSQETRGEWLIDPVLLDCGFQLAILWERAQHDMTPLPARFASYRRFASPSSSPVRCYLQAQSNGGGRELITNICFLDADSRMVGLLEGMEFSCSAALNRLAESAIHIEERQHGLA